MAAKRVIAICQSGGKFEMDVDGSLLYRGGEAHAIEIDEEMQLTDLKKEIEEMYNCSSDAISIKYFLPGNRKTLILVSNDKDLKHMIQFHADSVTTDVYVMMEETVVPDDSGNLASRSSRTTLSEADEPLAMFDDVTGDTMPTDIPITTPINVLDDDVNVDCHMETPADLSNVIPLAASYDEKHLKVPDQWAGTITGVGQRFNSVNEFREALRKYAIANHFSFKYKKNDSHRVTVKCKAEGCAWRIHASRLATTPLICIKKMDASHTCEGAGVTAGHQATRSWVASVIMDKVRESPDYKPKDIVNDIKQEFGIQLNYFQAWRGKEIAKEQLQGSYKEAYKKLPFLCEKITETNPGSYATFTTKENSSFHRLFVSFHASIFGFQQGCRPLLFLDSIPLKSKYQGVLLAASAADGDDGVFPVAFAVVDVETDDNWRWFLLQLKSALRETGSITFVADREKGLKESIVEICESPYHGYCLRYLTDQFIRDLKGQFSLELKRVLVQELYAAAYAPRPEGFQSCIENIKNISMEAYDWVVQSDPLHWANSLFEGARYNHMTSNFGELFYSWASDADELPITQMIDMIQVKIMELMYQRQIDSNHWVSRLTPSMEANLEKERLKISSLQVLLSAGSTFEVRGETIEVVDIDHLNCTCKGWQLTGLPCCHSIVVINCIGQSPYDYCSRYFSAESYHLTYSESIHHVPSSNCVPPKGSQASVIVTPPPTRRPPGRPSSKKVASQESAKRQLQCSNCKGVGHNKSTCKETVFKLDSDCIEMQG